MLYYHCYDILVVEIRHVSSLENFEEENARPWLESAFGALGKVLVGYRIDCEVRGQASAEPIPSS